MRNVVTTGSSVSQNYMEHVSDHKVLKVTLRLREQSRKSKEPNKGKENHSENLIDAIN